MVLENGRMQPMDDLKQAYRRRWMVANVDELATKMRWCYDYPKAARQLAVAMGAKWLRANQTWDRVAQKLIALMRQEGALPQAAREMAEMSERVYV